jgi:hypothetical protein
MRQLFCKCDLGTIMAKEPANFQVETDTKFPPGQAFWHPHAGAVLTIRFRLTDRAFGFLGLAGG